MATIADIEAGYENIAAICPTCGKRNVLNRATDVGHVSPIENVRIVCENDQCGAAFDAVGDLINPPYEMLLLDACDFIREKRYIQAVLSATTAYEMFFAHYIRVEFVLRASARDRTAEVDTIDWMNAAEQLLQDATRRHTFEPMRRIFLRAAVDNPRPMTVAAAEAYIRSIPTPKRTPAVPRTEIETLPDESLRALLLQVCDSRIADLRNDIVHKTAYRPRLDETRTAVDDAYRTIFRLGHHYKLASISYHLNESIEDM